MPYKVKGKCVYKKDSGKKVGCTKGSVKDYLAALHMHADESLDVTEDDLKGTIRSVIDDHAKEYVWGVKGPQRVANKYSIKTLIKNILLEQGMYDPNNPAHRQALDCEMAPIGNQLDKNTLELVVEYTMKKLEPLIQRLYGEETN